MTTLAEPERRRGPRTRTLLLLALPIALVLSAALVWQASYATFSTTDVTQNNTFVSATSVTLTDDSSSTALFTASNISPGATAAKCIAVTYTGTAPSKGVKLYVAPADLTNPGAGTLKNFLKFQVEEGTGGTFANCTGFTPAATVVTTQTAATLATAYSNYTNGAGGTWQPSATGTKVYKFTYTFDSAATNTEQGQTVGIKFTWETQS
jgi:hypothetical protein